VIQERKGGVIRGEKDDKIRLAFSYHERGWKEKIDRGPEEMGGIRMKCVPRLLTHPCAD